MKAFPYLNSCFLFICLFCCGCLFFIFLIPAIHQKITSAFLKINVGLYIFYIFWLFHIIHLFSKTDVNFDTLNIGSLNID